MEINMEGVKKGVKMVQVAFSIQIDRVDLETYSKLVFNRLQTHNVTLEEFNSSIAYFIDTQNKNYKQLPTIAEMLKFCNKQPKTVEQVAKEQAMLVWEGGYTYADKLLFDNATTNYVIENCYNGLSNFRWKYLNTRNEDRISDNWGQKDFISKWITAYESGKQKTEPLRSDACNSQSKLVMIGDVDKINLMLGGKSDNNKTIALISNLAKNIKGD